MELNGLEFNILKYLARWREKDGIKDLNKIIHYTQKLIEVENASSRKRESEQQNHDSGRGSR